MKDTPDDPIVECDMAKPFIAEVIDLDGVRIAWGRPVTRLSERCEHRAMLYSSEERRVWCSDCNRTIENFEAFMVLVKHFRDMEREARVKLATAAEAMASSVHRRMAKEFDRLWARGNKAILCPHCRRGMLPEDFERSGFSWCSREYEEARRKKDLAK